MTLTEAVPTVTAGPILPANVPTALTPAEANELYRLARGATVLEFGSLLGYSTIVLAQSAKVVYAVDPHHGYPVANPRDTLTQFMANLEANLVRDRVVPIIGRGQDVAPLLRPGEFDMVFIDITSAAEVLLYIALHLAPDVIAVHDYGIPKWTGATEAVDALALKYRRTFRLVDTLAIFDNRPLWPQPANGGPSL